MSAVTHPASSLDRFLPFWTEMFGVPKAVFSGVGAAVPADQQRTFFHTEAGRVLATVQVYVLTLNGASVAGVANVATETSARGRGLSTALLQEAIRWMEDSGLVSSYLFTGLPHHYARLGWKATQERVRLVHSQEDALAPNAPDLSKMAALYARNPPPFAMLRDEAWWRNVVHPRLTERPVWTAPDAYVVGSRSEEFEIVETVGEPEALTRLVLGATAWAGGRATLHGDLQVGVPDVRPGGMLRGGDLPQGAWFSALDHF